MTFCVLFAMRSKTRQLKFVAVTPSPNEIFKKQAALDAVSAPHGSILAVHLGPAAPSRYDEFEWWHFDRADWRL